MSIDPEDDDACTITESGTLGSTLGAVVNYLLGERKDKEMDREVSKREDLKTNEARIAILDYARIKGLTKPAEYYGKELIGYNGPYQLMIVLAQVIKDLDELKMGGR